MRILWMKPVLPFPPNQGTKRVTLQLLENLAPRHRIRLFTRLLEPGERAEVERLKARVPGLEVRAVLAPNRESPAHRVLYRIKTRWGALRGIPPVEGYTAPTALIRAFAREAEQFRPHLAVVEYWYGRSYIEAIRTPAVLFAHDIEYQVRSRAGKRQRERGRGGRWGALEVAREKTALAAAPYSWFLTEGDRKRAVADGGVDRERSAVLPYGLDLARDFPLRAAGDPDEDRDQVLLFGSFAADFNRDALAFTLEEVWPELRRLRPQTRLVVAGGGMSKALAERCRAAGARVVGEVSDVRALLLGAAVVLVPLRFGGGLRIRLLESLALGRAVVGTPVGVLGMGAARDREVLVGDTAEEVAGQTARVLEEPALRDELGRAGRRWIEENHDADGAAQRQNSLVERTRHRLTERGDDS